jgi:hypothetical protein
VLPERPVRVQRGSGAQGGLRSPVT